MHPTILKAIRERRVLRLVYGAGSRVVEPHVCGAGRAGQGLLRAFQTAGASASGAPYAWKLFRLDRIESVELLDARFPGPRPRFRRRDRAMTGRTVGLKARAASEAPVRAAANARSGS
jgi:predicted DNA-binding transcriptional regulator YafY